MRLIVMFEVNQIYALVIHVESLWGLGVVDGSKDPMSMMVGRVPRTNDHQKFLIKLKIIIII